jgi:hypothetical protein
MTTRQRPLQNFDSWHFRVILAHKHNSHTYMPTGGVCRKTTGKPSIGIAGRPFKVISQREQRFSRWGCRSSLHEWFPMK